MAVRRYDNARLVVVQIDVQCGESEAMSLGEGWGWPIRPS